MQEKQVILAQAQGEAFQMIESELQNEKGKLAAQFIMGQRYINAMAKQAKSDNVFLVRQDMNKVTDQVHNSINMLDLMGQSKEEAETPKKTTRKASSKKSE